ncbi:MAG TPA: GDSL family lipase, partial [Nitrospiraceae bacterium]|nr:GDSL family lipase [Nitrospiraceae bacterium]
AGETVEGLFRRIGGIIKTCHSPHLIFIMTGINNVASGDLDFIDTYRGVCNKLFDAYPSAKIFIHSLLPNRLPWISPDFLQSVNRSIKKLAQETGVEYLDLYPEFLDKDDTPSKAYFLDDGVHLSQKGYAIWSDVLATVINR